MLVHMLLVSDNIIFFHIKNMGFVYIVTSDLVNAIKIGMTKNIKQRFKAYHTTYGSKLHSHFVETKNMKLLERRMHDACKNFRLESNHELFLKNKVHNIDFYYNILQQLNSNKPKLVQCDTFFKRSIKKLKALFITH